MEGNASIRSLIGRQVSHYRIVDRLGVGGMGVVYKATDLQLDRTVALKFLPPQFCYDEHLKQRFVQEAKSASALDHPNIGTIHGIEETEDGQLFIVMAFYDGETLSAKIQRAPLPLGQAIDLGLQIARGLSSAHQKSIIHRDIKPSNVVITTDGYAKVVDFGLAQFAGGIGLTQPGATLGTAAYMSPEQAQGNPVDQRTDIWSLGIVLFEMLIGTLPFGGSSLATVLHGIIHNPVPDLPEWVPPQVRNVVQRALSKDPGTRYNTAQDLVRDLEVIQGTLGTAERTQTVIMDSAGSAGASSRSPSLKSGLLRSQPIQWVRSRSALASVIVVLILSPAVFLSSTMRLRLATMLTGGHLPVRRLVILPFTNIGNDPANAALCDGLVEVLTSKLTSLDRLQKTLSVVPASEVRRRKVNSPGEARKEFKANLVVLGSVQRDAAGITLSINLVDAADVSQVGSAVFRSATGALFSVQDEAVAKLAELLNVNGKTDVIRGSPKDAPAVPAVYETYLKGVGLLQRYDKPANLDGAIALFQQTVATDPQFALGYQKLGEAYLLKYRIAKDPQSLRSSQENSTHALSLNDKLPGAYVTLGFIHESSGHHDLAIQECQHALQMDERNADAYQGLARAYESVGRVSEAELNFQKAIDLNPDAWEGYSRLAAFYNRQGRYQEALSKFRQVVQIAPDNSLGYLNVGALLFRLGKPQEAVAMYKKSLELAPSYVAYSNLGGVYYQERLYGDAARAYDQALKMNDKDYRIWRNLAASYKKSNGLDRLAINAYEQADKRATEFLQANPQDADALADLADIKINLGQKDGGERLVRKATALAPNQPGVLLKATDIYEMLGDRVQALNWLESALKHGLPRESVMRESDLGELRKDPRFAEAISRHRGLVEASGLNRTAK